MFLEVGGRHGEAEFFDLRLLVVLVCWLHGGVAFAW